MTDVQDNGGGRSAGDGRARRHEAPPPGDQPRLRHEHGRAQGRNEAQPLPGDRVRVERHGPLATVVLDHAAKMNVLDRRGWERLGEVFRDLAADDSVRCVLVRGAGGRAFSAGSDVGSFAAHRMERGDVARYAESVRSGIDGVWGCPHPTVAAVEGVCAGGGLIVACCCDVRVSGASARFGAPVNRLGLTMAYEEMAPVLAAAGAGALLEILLTGELLGAERAREAGVVHRVVPDGEVRTIARAVAESVMAGAPLANRWHKKFVRRLADASPLTPAERAEPYESCRTRDYREGVAAFLEKRTPRFEGE